jgi:hypothetical protein
LVSLSSLISTFFGAGSAGVVGVSGIVFS